MSDTPPTGEEILAQHTAEQLFGEASTDLRQLKRSYAKLIRRFRPDDAPEVFQHIHAMYQAQRSRLESRSTAEAPGATSPPPVAAAPPMAPPSPAPTSPPAHDLASSLPAIARLARTAPDVALQRLQHQLDQAPLHTPAATLLQIHELLDTAAFGDVFVTANRLRRQVNQVLAWQAACADPRVPSVITELINRCWRCATKPAVPQLRQLAPRLAELDAGELQELLIDEHPGLMPMLWEMETSLLAYGTFAACQPQLPDAPTPTAVMGALRKHATARPLDFRHYQRRGLTGAAGIATALISGLVIFLFIPSIPDRLIVRLAGFLGIAVGTMVWARVPDHPAPVPDIDLVAAARSVGATPHEMVCALGDVPGSPLVEHARVRYSRSRTAWLVLLTPALLDRLDARVSAMEAT